MIRGPADDTVCDSGDSSRLGSCGGGMSCLRDFGIHSWSWSWTELKVSAYAVKQPGLQLRYRFNVKADKLSTSLL